MNSAEQGIYLDPIVAILLLAAIFLLALVWLVAIFVVVLSGFSLNRSPRKTLGVKKRKQAPKSKESEVTEDFGQEDGLDTAERVARELLAGHDVGRRDQLG